MLRSSNATPRSLKIESNIYNESTWSSLEMLPKFLIGTKQLPFERSTNRYIYNYLCSQFLSNRCCSALGNPYKQLPRTVGRGDRWPPRISCGAAEIRQRWPRVTAVQLSAPDLVPKAQPAGEGDAAAAAGGGAHAAAAARAAAHTTTAAVRADFSPWQRHIFHDFPLMVEQVRAMCKLLLLLLLLLLMQHVLLLLY